MTLFPEFSSGGNPSYRLSSIKMSISDIQALPLREKFQILEALWQDLASRIDQMPVSDGDKAILDERLAALDAGETGIHDWDAVKDSIGKR